MCCFMYADTEADISKDKTMVHLICPLTFHSVTKVTTANR